MSMELPTAESAKPPTTGTPDLDAAKPIVDAWLQARGTSMAGDAYAAALDLVAFSRTHVAEAPTTLSDAERWLGLLSHIDTVSATYDRANRVRTLHAAFKRNTSTTPWMQSAVTEYVDDFVSAARDAVPDEPPSAPASTVSPPVNVTPAMREWLKYLARGNEITRSPNFHTGPYTTVGRGGLTWRMVIKLQDAGLIRWEPVTPELSFPRVKAVLTDAGYSVIQGK